MEADSFLHKTSTKLFEEEKRAAVFDCSLCRGAVGRLVERFVGQFASDYFLQCNIR